MERRRLLVLAGALIALAVVTLIVIHGISKVSTPLVVVEGNSMLPTLYNGDLVLIYKPPPDSIEVGDIIVYRSPFRGKLVIHRVIEVNQCGDTVCYVTKGDNNVRPDNSPALGLEPSKGIPYDQVLGVVVGIRVNGRLAPLRIPYLGILTMVLRG